MTEGASSDRRRDRPPVQSIFARAASPLVDLVTLALYFWLVPWIAQRFAAHDGWNVLMVVAAYLLMCWGFWTCKALKRAPQVTAGDTGDAVRVADKAPGEGQGCAQGLSVPFAIFVAVMAIEGSGVLDPGPAGSVGLEDMTGRDGVLISLAVVGGFIGLLLFPLVLFAKRKPVVEYGTAKHLLYRLLGVGGVNLMVLVSTAYWQFQLADAEPMDVAIGGRILIFICVYIVFLMFYAAPRLALIELEPGQWSYLSFAVMLGVFVWRLMG